MITAQDPFSYPRLCALLGKRPSRLSQAMHNAGFARLGLAYTYVAFSTENTAMAIEAMRALGIRGYSLTIPHKEAAVGLVDVLSEDAQKILAINTIVNDGKELRGYNTDWQGIVGAFAEAGVKVAEATVFLLGAGGAARAALYALGLLGVRKVYIANRNFSRAAELAKEFDAEAVEYAKAEKYVKKASLVVNATPLASAAAQGNVDYPFDLSVPGEGQTVFDMVTGDTPLLSAARSNGAVCIPGIRMLLHQAAAQFELFTQQNADVGAMEEALLAEYART